ncbi:hypothetical protein ACP4OV_002032 [Aristida adscensionis]
MKRSQLPPPQPLELAVSEHERKTSPMPSLIPLTRGVGKVIHVKKMVTAGCRVKIVMADYFALLNKKMGGDLDVIRAVGHNMMRTWKALGMDLDGVQFLWSSEEISKHAGEYWPVVLDIARRNSFERIISCSGIMGRSVKDDLTSGQDDLTSGQFLYPIMQCADVFFLKVDICHMGMDQKEVNMLARDYYMLPGLKEGQQKMSNSDPTSAIFMEDEESVVNQKIKKAFCPPKIIEGNPCLDYIEHIVFPWFGKFDVLRKEANGGDKTYTAIKEVFADYATGALHPADVKTNLAKAINQILQPVRDHFNSNSDAKFLLNTVKSLVEDLPSSSMQVTLEERFTSLRSIGASLKSASRRMS